MERTDIVRKEADSAEARGVALSRRSFVEVAVGTLVALPIVNGGIALSPGVEKAHAIETIIVTARCDDQTLAHFLGIRVDDEPVSESNYTVEAGSVVITLLPEYLETLSEGAHTMEVLFDDGPAVAVSFNVKKQSNTANDNSTTQSNTTNSNSTTKGTAKAPST